MTEMIERVARALAKTNGGDFYDPNFYTEEQRNVWRTKARDGIEAMRVPTANMTEEGKYFRTSMDPAFIWSVMIDEALK